MLILAAPLSWRIDALGPSLDKWPKSEIRLFFITGIHFLLCLILLADYPIYSGDSTFNNVQAEVKEIQLLLPSVSLQT